MDRAFSFKKEAIAEVAKTCFLFFGRQVAKVGCKKTENDWLSMQKGAMNSNCYTLLTLVLLV